MSLPPGCSWVGSQPELFQASVNGWVYSRVAETGACAVPPGLSGLRQASWALALLLSVVSVGCPVFAVMSQGRGAATLRTGPVWVVQPLMLVQQPMTLLRGLVFGAQSSVGLAVKYRHCGSGRALSAPGAAVSLEVTSATQLPGGVSGAVGFAKGQTCRV